MRQVSTVIDIGTGKVVSLISEGGPYEQCSVLGSAAGFYPGFQNRHWIDKHAVAPAILDSLREAEKQAGVRVREAHIAVPADFTRVVCANTELTFEKKHVITEDDIALLFRQGRSKLHIPDEYMVIHRCPVTFVLDGRRRTMEPEGQQVTQIRAIVSYVLAEKWFRTVMSKILARRGVSISTLISASYAQTMHFIPALSRDSGAILVDIGRFSTAVCTARGDGILYHGVLPLGGEAITHDISVVFGLDREMAEALKHRSIYGLSLNEDDFYEVSDKGSFKFHRFSAIEVQNVIEARLDELFSMIADCIRKHNRNIPDYAKVYLTGGAASMRGIREFAQKALGRNIILLQPQATQLNKPCYSSALAVMNMALDVEATEDSGAFRGFLGLFSKK